MKAEQLLNDIARTLGLPELALNDEGCARLLFDGKVAVNFENDALAEKLHLYADLGELPLRGREALYRALLEANLFGAQTAGATLSLDGPGDMVVLCRTLVAEELSLAAFTEVVEGFVATAEAWQDKLAAGGFGSAEASGERLPGEPVAATAWPPNPARFMQV
jgi:hypothetical protein